MNVAIAGSGQAVQGVITLSGENGTAVVAVGDGAVSGDMDADINAASAGTYVITIAEASPQDEAATRELVNRFFPSLASVGLTTQTSEGGYVFSAENIDEGINLAAGQVSATANVVYAGTNAQGQATVVWVLVATGELAKDIAQ